MVDRRPDETDDEPLDEQDEPQPADMDDEEPSDTAKCPKCGAEVYADADRCPKCGQYITPLRGKRPLLRWLVLALLAAGAVLLVYLAAT